MVGACCCYECVDDSPGGRPWCCRVYECFVASLGSHRTHRVRLQSYSTDDKDRSFSSPKRAKLDIPWPIDSSEGMTSIQYHRRATYMKKHSAKNCGQNAYLPQSDSFSLLRIPQGYQSDKNHSFSSISQLSFFCKWSFAPISRLDYRRGILRKSRTL